MKAQPSSFLRSVRFPRRRALQGRGRALPQDKSVTKPPSADGIELEKLVALFSTVVRSCSHLARSDSQRRAGNIRGLATQMRPTGCTTVRGFLSHPERAGRLWIVGDFKDEHPESSVSSSRGLKERLQRVMTSITGILFPRA